MSAETDRQASVKPYMFRIPGSRGVDVCVERQPNGDVFLAPDRHGGAEIVIPADIVKLVAWAMLGEA